MAFLTQDALPADAQWLARLLSGFALADDVALVYGPVAARRRALRSRSGASWTRGSPRSPPTAVRGSTARAHPPARVRRRSSPAPTRRSPAQRVAAVPFPDVPYAEDQALARDMLRAGYAKAFMPDAAVIHSHDYAALAQFRRAFDEWRALHEVHGWVQPLEPVNTLLKLQSEVRKDLRGLPPRDALCARPRARCATGPSAPPARSPAHGRSSSRRACARGARSTRRARAARRCSARAC